MGGGGGGGGGGGKCKKGRGYEACMLTPAAA